MFHWLRATGRGIGEAFGAFEEYHRKASYEELGFETPDPLESGVGILMNGRT